jgi:phage terminase small subunit
LANRKKQIEAQLARLDGQQENVLKNKDLFEEMDMNKDVVDALKINNRAIKDQVNGMKVLEVEDLLEETHELQTDVSEISNVLAFQGGDSIYNLEGDEYLEELEQQMEEENTARLLSEFASVPTRNNNNNNNNDFVVVNKPRARQRQNQKEKDKRRDVDV